MAEERSYDRFIKEENMTSNAEVRMSAEEFEDDFM
jgi:hypothetical protein